jgi:hypothetical protein
MPPLATVVQLMRKTLGIGYEATFRRRTHIGQAVFFLNPMRIPDLYRFAGHRRAWMYWAVILIRTRVASSLRSTAATIHDLVLNPTADVVTSISSRSRTG